jgi:hypothetical protein
MKDRENEIANFQKALMPGGKKSIPKGKKSKLIEESVSYGIFGEEGKEIPITELDLQPGGLEIPIGELEEGPQKEEKHEGGGAVEELADPAVEEAVRKCMGLLKS